MQGNAWIALMIGILLAVAVMGWIAYCWYQQHVNFGVLVSQAHAKVNAGVVRDRERAGHPGDDIERGLPLQAPRYTQRGWTRANTRVRSRGLNVHQPTFILLKGTKPGQRPKLTRVIQGSLKHQFDHYQRPPKDYHLERNSEPPSRISRLSPRQEFERRKHEEQDQDYKFKNGDYHHEETGKYDERERSREARQSRDKHSSNNQPPRGRDNEDKKLYEHRSKQAVHPWPESNGGNGGDSHRKRNQPERSNNANDGDEGRGNNSHNARSKSDRQNNNNNHGDNGHVDNPYNKKSNSGRQSNKSHKDEDHHESNNNWGDLEQRNDDQGEYGNNQNNGRSWGNNDEGNNDNNDNNDAGWSSYDLGNAANENPDPNAKWVGSSVGDGDGNRRCQTTPLPQYDKNEYRGGGQNGDHGNRYRGLPSKSRGSRKDSNNHNSAKRYSGSPVRSTRPLMTEHDHRRSAGSQGDRSWGSKQNKGPLDTSW